MENWKMLKKKAGFTLMVMLIVAGIAITGTVAKAENHTDAAPYIQPADANGLKILFDNTHGQTAGAADWVIDGGFSDFANALASDGYYVQELRKGDGITYSDLADYDVFIIPEANVPYKSMEQDAIVQYVQNGGSVFFIADHYNADRNKNRWDASEVFNGYRRGAYLNPTLGMGEEESKSGIMQNVISSDWLADNFGVRFRYNALGDISATMIAEPKESFGITEHVASVAMHAGSTIAILKPEIAKGIVYLPDGLTQKDAWPNAVDTGVYNGGGIKEGAYVAIAKVGQGKAAFLGDSSAAEDASPKYRREENGKKKTTYDGFAEEDDAVLLTQLIDWLTLKESYTTFSEAGITLDEPTRLHDYELPENSTEPKKEPWSSPEAGYKWWDTATFKVGAYGYTGSETVSDPEYSFILPDTIVTGKEQTMTVKFSGMAANTTYKDYRIGAYVTGGQQIAKFSLDGEAYPNIAGYSSNFTITADANGNAEKTVHFIMNPGTIGSFNLRLKQGSSNLITKSYSVAE